MKRLILGLSLLLSAAFAHGQVLLDNFNTGTNTGAIVGGSSWVGQVTQHPTNIAVGGTATDVNGWAATGQSINATGMNYVAVTASVPGDNVAASFAVRFSDDLLANEIVTISMSAFTTSLTTVYIPIAWTSGIDIANITSWSIGGGNVGSSTFHMTLDNLALTSTAAIPEPSTYAAIAGVMALGLVAWRRRQAARA